MDETMSTTTKKADSGEGAAAVFERGI